jgi:protein involved in polysaccharide export with SLBB domain
MLLVLISFAPLGFGIMAIFPQARFAEVARVSSDAWQQLLAAMPTFHHARVLLVPAATPARIADLPPTLAVMPDSADAGRIAYGDRLKISFFESLGVALDAPGTGSDQTVAAVFPRMDLSGEYSVDEAGLIDIPRLGQLLAAGATIPALQSGLAANFKHAFGRTSDVHVAIVERQPVYVTGKVRTAGAFKYMPGMIVLQVLANAGGSDQGVADTSRAIERIRETERVHQTEDRLDRLRIRQAELTALRDKADSIDLPADIRSRLNEKRLQDVLAGATATLALERKGRQQEVELAERRVSIAQLEVQAQQLRIDQIKDLLTRKREKLRETEAIAARGSVSQYKLIDMGAEISELEAKQEDLRAALAQAQRHLIEALSAEARTKFDNSLRMQQELAQTAQDIEDCMRSIASMQAVVEVLQDGPASGSPGHFDLRITRKTQGRFSVIPATEMTPLLPGDVLQVDAGGSAELPVSRVAQDSPHSKNGKEQ